MGLLKKLLLLGASITASLVLLELSIGVLVGRRVLQLPRPTGVTIEAQFYDGNHPVFGTWHHADASMVHRSPCFRATYESNSIGARDRERARESGAPRVVFLGDSIVEGWGLDDRKRMSNRLEADTGIEHLNFGMAHFGPYQSLFVYRQLAKQFDHAAVILAILPENDLIDIDFERARGLEDYAYRYRPYLIRAEQGFEHYDHRENPVVRELRRRSYAYQAGVVAVDALRTRLGWKQPPPPVGSGYYDIDDERFARLEFILDELGEEAGDRDVILFLVPTLRDFARYDRQHPPPLSRRLEAYAKRDRVWLVDPLDHMARAARTPASFSFRCDYQWNAEANAVAADYLRRELDGILYDPVEHGP